MEINEYQRQAMTTLNKDIPEEQILLNAALGLSGEVGEVNDLLKKHLFQGHELDKDRIIEELGDVAWYLAEAATALKIDLNEVLLGNLTKLKKRFPHGFDSKRSIDR